MYQMDKALCQHLHKCDDPLKKHLSQATGDDQEITVLLQRKTDLDTMGTAALDEFVSNVGCTVVKELPIIDAKVVRVPLGALGQLASHHHIHRIHLDRTMHALLDTAAPTIGAIPEWESGLTGKGVTIAILDTGIYPHSDLKSRLVGFYDAIQGKKDPYDDNGHGTHVAGCAAGDGKASGGKYKGPAYEASVVGVKVLDASGQGSVSDIIDGVQWCLQSRDTFGIRILSLSLGGPAYESYRNDPLCQALEKAWKAGLAVFVAAGNEGPSAGTIGTPAIHPLLITVGATDDRNSISDKDDSIATFSSRGPTIDGLVKPDIVAPGVNIISLRSPGSTIDRAYPSRRVDQQYVSLSGTSMATPICSGAAALLLQAKPSLTPDELKAALLDGARDLFQSPQDAGKGYVDLQAALELIGREGKQPRSTPVTPRRTVVAYTPAIASLLWQELDGAKESIELEVPRLTDIQTITAVANAAQRGVRVRLLIDAAAAENRETVRFLEAKGVEVESFNSVSSHSGQLHTAIAIFDRTRVLMGSGAWTYEELFVAREHAILTDDPQVTAPVMTVWQEDWEQAGQFVPSSVAAAGG
ncbi:S8 family serine peptidase [Brevibacillus sp. TJ4]|uniref:S8 family serine peptidase n=1 Tax=Brevibacillus sp. TJ4 TaxID=3234853 RepID=UPI0037D48435